MLAFQSYYLYKPAITELKSLNKLKPNNEIKRLFKLYLEGQTNGHQEEVLFRYLKSRKGTDEELFNQMENTWVNEPAPRDDSTEGAENMQQLWAKIDERKQGKNNRNQLFKYAASLVLICSATLAWFNYQQQQPKTVKTIALLSKTTAPGEKLKMILPDSSVVYLGSRSKLTWPERFIKGQHRSIRLEGEAFFEVKRDTTSPFIIHSGNMETRVLGTSFNIYAYPGDKIFSVAVRTGKVAVAENSSAGQKRLSLLTPGMRLIFQKTNGDYAINDVRVADVSSWTTNRFVFHDESLNTMLIKLERYYSVRFDLKNLAMINCRFNATFTNKNIIDVMKQLSIMSGGHIKYKMTDDKKTIALWGRACQ